MPRDSSTKPPKTSKSRLAQTLKFSTQWTKHIQDASEKEQFKRNVLASRDVLEVLNNILTEWYDADLKEMRKRENYTLPNWSVAMADHLATQRTLERVRKLLEV